MQDKTAIIKSLQQYLVKLSFKEYKTLIDLSKFKLKSGTSFSPGNAFFVQLDEEPENYYLVCLRQVIIGDKENKLIAEHLVKLKDGQFFVYGLNAQDVRFKYQNNKEDYIFFRSKEDSVDQVYTDLFECANILKGRGFNLMTLEEARSLLKDDKINSTGVMLKKLQIEQASNIKIIIDEVIDKEENKASEKANLALKTSAEATDDGEGSEITPEKQQQPNKVLADFLETDTLVFNVNKSFS